ncbi:RNA polymerase sigma factor, partial [Bradyrhizobium sp. NBAIM08]|uniref:RNA polymerase sigma factor n=1 Tax=Bradyrhizobium sp. NBAIM08 TaxID=2793815 RepID=UPI0023EE89C2
MTDRELLERFRTSRDEDAFEGLVLRHGPMVLGLCRRVLRDAHEADDVFQATFLLLARNAGTIRDLDSVAGWLYGVAYRIAVREKAGARRRLAGGRDLAMAVTGIGEDRADEDRRDR